MHICKKKKSYVNSFFCFFLFSIQHAKLWFTYDSVSKGGVRSMMQVLKIKFVCDTDFLMYILPVVCVFSKNYQKNLVVHVKVDLFQLF